MNERRNRDDPDEAMSITKEDFANSSRWENTKKVVQILQEFEREIETQKSPWISMGFIRDGRKERFDPDLHNF